MSADAGLAGVGRRGHGSNGRRKIVMGRAKREPDLAALRISPGSRHGSRGAWAPDFRALATLSLEIWTFLYITTCRARSALPSGVSQRARMKEFSLALVSKETTTRGAGAGSGGRSTCTD
jgi:hypothetical protein